MIPSLAKLLPLATASGRARAQERKRRDEARLELALTWGAGHVLVTGTDRTETRDLLERVLRRIDALGAVRAPACSADAELALDGVVALSIDDGPLPASRRERREALSRLVGKARSLRRSIFVVVDDGDEATVEQLERLRASVEVTPEALERLRLIFLGGPTLVTKLGQRGARALSSRISARIRVSPGVANRWGPGAMREAPPPQRAMAIAAGAFFALVAYGSGRALFPPRTAELETADYVVQKSVTGRPVAATGEETQVVTSLHGDEPFLGRPLEIPIHAKWTTGSALFPPPNPAVPVVVGAPAEVASLDTAPAETASLGAQTKPSHAARQDVVPVVAAAPAPVKVTAELAAGTSIAALVERFR
jgi:hypothetical protein